MLGGHHRRQLGVRWRRMWGVSTFVRIQIKENLALLHPHIALSFKLQPLSKCVRIKTQIQYSYCSLKFFFFLMKVRGRQKIHSFHTVLWKAWACCSLVKLLLRSSNTSVYFTYFCSPPHHSIRVYDMLTVCLWGRKILLSPLSRQNQETKWFAQSHMGNLWQTRS